VSLMTADARTILQVGQVSDSSIIEVLETPAGTA
jgi:hypothetical protein